MYYVAEVTKSFFFFCMDYNIYRYIVRQFRLHRPHENVVKPFTARSSVAHEYKYVWYLLIEPGMDQIRIVMGTAARFFIMIAFLLLFRFFSFSFFCFVFKCSVNRYSYVEELALR